MTVTTINDFDDFPSRARYWLGKLGEFLLEKALVAFYMFTDPETPTKVKAALGGALLYLVSPLDAIPDFLLGGFADDASVLVATLAGVAAAIRWRHVRAARRTMTSIGLNPRPIPDGVNDDDRADIL